MHFSVLVVTDERPSKEVITRALRPFCSEQAASEFLVDVDVTAAAMEEYDRASGAKLRSPDGRLHERFDEAFYREPTPEEDAVILATRDWSGVVGGVSFLLKAWSDGMWSARVRFVPEGWVEVPNPVGHNQTFAAFCQDYYGIAQANSWEPIDLDGEHYNGHVLVDAEGNVHKVVKRTTKNGHWDWWEVGGRFSGILNSAGGRDICKRGDISILKLMKEDEKHRRKAIVQMAGKAGIAEADMGNLLEVYRRAVTDWKADGKGDWEAHRLWMTRRDERLAPILEDLSRMAMLKPGQTLDEYYRDGQPFGTYAVVMDGQWMEAEREAFWRMKPGTHSDSDWSQKCWEIFRDLPPSKWLAIVDCHN